MPDVLKQREGHVLVLTLNRPDRMNAIGGDVLTLLGRTLESSELDRLGLVNKVVNADALMDEAMAWAQEIASNAPLAVAAAKRSMRLGLDAGFEANMTQVLAETMQLFRSEDFGEGLASFLEKRPADFKGR
jgi:enoyl-CoA hydratase/carnithine racemase